MIIDIFLPTSLAFIMFSLGIRLKINDFKNILNHPKAFVVGILNQMIVLPLIAFIIISIFKLDSNLSIGIMILACCPGGVTSNMITKIAKGDTALSISYTAIASITTVITLPLIVAFSINHFELENTESFNMLWLSLEMILIAVVPVSIGLCTNTKYSNFSSRIDPIVNKISTVLFIIIVVGALASNWNIFIQNLSLLGPAIILLITMMFLIGYNSAKILGVSKKQTITISIESGIQNATLGIFIGGKILPLPEGMEGLSSLSLPSGVYGVLMFFVSLPFIFWFLKNN
tara:strand:+ start:161 stop:1024 length:864 start_codon:yes stop_codon:yes gene_type:complete